MAGASDDAETLLQSDESDAEMGGGGGGFTCFLSYCDADSDWAQELVARLEGPECGFRVCHHERDFLAGKPVVDNMADAVRRSQKILLVMSADYLSSRWCTWETHMGILGNTTVGKAIVPIVVGPVELPFTLSHLTRLDSADPNFLGKLETVLRTPNNVMELSAALPAPSRTMHSGMLLLVMSPRERNLRRWEVGTFNEYFVPPVLDCLVSLQDFVKAMTVINKPPEVPFFKEEVTRRKYTRLLATFVVAVIGGYVALYESNNRFGDNLSATIPSACGAALLAALLAAAAWYVHTWPRHEYRRQQTRLHRRVGEANLVLLTSGVLAGCGPRGELQFVYARVGPCHAFVAEQLAEARRGAAAPGEADGMFAKAVRLFSCAYVAAAVRKDFPRSELAHSVGHAEVGMCLCEYAGHMARARHDLSLAQFLARRSKLTVSDYKLSDIHA